MMSKEMVLIEVQKMSQGVAKGRYWEALGKVSMPRYY
jgi:hypothetical protein